MNIKMNKNNSLLLGAIAIGFLFILSSKTKSVFAQTSIPNINEPIPSQTIIPNINEPIPLKTQIISTNTTTDMSTSGASTIITVLD